MRRERHSELDDPRMDYNHNLLRGARFHIGDSGQFYRVGKDVSSGIITRHDDAGNEIEVQKEGENEAVSISGEGKNFYMVVSCPHIHGNHLFTRDGVPVQPLNWRGRPIKAKRDI